jgi:hypothetical protein
MVVLTIQVLTFQLQQERPILAVAVEVAQKVPQVLVALV